MPSTSARKYTHSARQVLSRVREAIASTGADAVTGVFPTRGGLDNVLARANHKEKTGIWPHSESTETRQTYDRMMRETGQWQQTPEE